MSWGGRARNRSGLELIACGILLLVQGCQGTSPSLGESDLLAMASREMGGEALIADERPVAPLTEAEGGAARAWVLDLSSQEFLIYTHAAGQLVALGERVLPLLVEEEGLRRLDFGVASSATGPVVNRILEGLPPERLLYHLRSSSPVVQRSAVIHLGERKAIGTVPHLIAGLSSASPTLRPRIFEALRSITGLPESAPPSWEDEAPTLVDSWTLWWRTRPIGEAGS